MQILLTLVRINEVTLARLSNGVYGQIAPAQILFEGDIWTSINDETTMALSALALGARKGVLFFRLRM